MNADFRGYQVCRNSFRLYRSLNTPIKKTVYKPKPTHWSQHVSVACCMICLTHPYYIEYQDNGVTLIRNPVNPFENFADNWQEYPSRKESFIDWLKQVQRDLTDALELCDIHSIEKSLKSYLGEQTIKEGLQNLSKRKGGV